MSKFTISNLVSLADSSEDIEEVVSTELLDWHLKGYLLLPHSINDYYIDDIELYIKTMNVRLTGSANEFVKTHVIYLNHTPFAVTLENNDNTSHHTHIINSEILDDLIDIIIHQCSHKNSDNELISFLDNNINADITHLFTNKDFKRRVLKC